MKIPQDKQLHFLGGMLAASFVGLFGNIGLAFGAAILLGLVKDVAWDKWLGRGTYDPLDIVATVLGGLPPVFVMLFI